MDDHPICLKYRTTKDFNWYIPLWVGEELETTNAKLRAKYRPFELGESHLLRERAEKAEADNARLREANEALICTVRGLETEHAPSSVRLFH